MIKTEIKSINNYNYVLYDGKIEYNLNLEFYDLENKLKIGDIIYIPKELLKNNGLYSYGKIINNNEKDSEYIKILSDDKEIYLQRYYG